MSVNSWYQQEGHSLAVLGPELAILDRAAELINAHPPPQQEAKEQQGRVGNRLCPGQCPTEEGAQLGGVVWMSAIGPVAATFVGEKKDWI